MGSVLEIPYPESFADVDIPSLIGETVVLPDSDIELEIVDARRVDFWGVGKPPRIALTLASPAGVWTGSGDADGFTVENR